jgi:kynurenine formamidase
VVVSSTLPEAASFDRFETIDYATTNFDGETVSYTVLQLPAQTTVGPMSSYIEVRDVDLDTLATSFHAAWQGQMPGSIFVADAVIGGGQVETSGPETDGEAEKAATQEPTDEAVPTEESTEQPTSEPGTPQPVADAAANAVDETPEESDPSLPEVGVISFDLWDMLDLLEHRDFVDLTHTFAPGIPHWSGFPDAEFNIVHDYDSDGFLAHEYVHVGEYGTHLDSPAHFGEGLKSVDQIDLKEMVAPLVVINVVDKVSDDPDYQLTVDDIRAWEAKYGSVPKGAFVAMRTDWSKRWPDEEAYINEDESGQAHYPGWTVDALQYLYDEREIAGTGHETLDAHAADARTDNGLAAERYALGTDHYRVDSMTNLDRVPEAGAIVFVTVPKPENAAAFPARVFAIVP